MDIKVDSNIAKGIVEMLGQLQMDYSPSKARNVFVEHLVERMKEAVPNEALTEGGEDGD